MIVENECFQLKPLQFCWIIDKYPVAGTFILDPIQHHIQYNGVVLSWDIVQDKTNWSLHNMRSGAALADAAVVLKGCGVVQEKLNFTVP